MAIKKASDKGAKTSGAKHAKAENKTEVNTLTEEQVSELINKLAQTESELATAAAVQDAANQNAIWAFNAMGASDAFIDTKRHGNLIERLSKQSQIADAIKAESDTLLTTLREESREIRRQLGAHINNKKIETARKQAEDKANKAAASKKTASASDLKQVEAEQATKPGSVNKSNTATNAKANKAANGNAAKKKPTFREFAESKGQKWPMKPEVAAKLKVQYDKL